MQKKTEFLQELKETLSKKKLTKNKIFNLIHTGLLEGFGFSQVSIYLVDSLTAVIKDTYPEIYWPLPKSENDWLITRTKKLLKSEDKSLKESLDYLYISDRSASSFCDQNQLLKDQQKYDFNCKDGLYWILISEENIILGLIFINNWNKKELLSGINTFDAENLAELRDFLTNGIFALDNYLTNQKIEALLTDKQQLKARIQRDETELKNRILELSVLYDASISLGHSLNYFEIVSLMQDAMGKVLKVDISSILLLNFSPGGDFFLRINTKVPEEIVKSIKNHVLAVVVPFIKHKLDKTIVNFTSEEKFTNSVSEATQIKSFVNVPLIFKEEFLGLINVSSISENVFSKDEITFLYTIANQLAINIGRLKMVKDMEKSKIGTMIASMVEGVIMLDDDNRLETINPAAKEMLGFIKTDKISTEQIIEKFSELDIMSLYYDALLNDSSILDKEIVCKDKILSASLTPVKDVQENRRVGMTMVLRDITEWQKINKIKTQRLEIISRVHLIINSITDLDNLLTVLMEFVLNVGNTEMGSIQLKEGKEFRTRVHSNFPDKIRREYKFKSGETITERVINSKELICIEDYPNNNEVDQDTKILVDYYLCIPIMVTNDLIGVVNIVKKNELGKKSEVTLDDIQTLTTITSLSGTAIYNALLFLETLKKQKMDQELRVAYEIQNKLLPQKLPESPMIEFSSISVPARAIGGDYFDFFKLDSGNIGLVIADIVGKGVPAALLMVMVKSILQTNISHIDSPAETMKHINEILYNDPVFNKYVPMLYCVINPQTLSVKYCNAGHEPALFFSNLEFQILDSEGFPLGAWPDAEFEEKELILNDGDIIALFTDGISEARNTQGVDFGLAKLQELITKYSTLPAKDLIESIYADILEYTEEAEQHDDLTMVIVKADKNLVNLVKEKPKEIKEIRVKSNRKNISKIRDEVNIFTQKMGFTEEQIFNIKLAVNEAQANVLEHAYQGDEYGDIAFKFMDYDDRLEIVIKDFGRGMDSKTIKGEKFLDELEGSGLGVFLIKSLMDKVEYKRLSKIGTELKLTKFLHKEV